MLLVSFKNSILILKTKVLPLYCLNYVMTVFFCHFKNILVAAILKYHKFHDVLFCTDALGALQLCRYCQIYSEFELHFGILDSKNMFDYMHKITSSLYYKILWQPFWISLPFCPFDS